MGFRISGDHKRCLEVQLSGRLDGGSAPDIKEQFASLRAKRRRNVVVVVKDVQYASSAVLRALKDERNELERGADIPVIGRFVSRRFVLAEPNENMVKVLDLTGLRDPESPAHPKKQLFENQSTEVPFEVYSRTEDAIGSF